MSRFIPGDYVRPINPTTDLPRGSVWVVRYHNKDAGTVELYPIGTVELYPIGSTFRDGYLPSYVIGRVFADHNFEKVVMVDGQWCKAAVGKPTKTGVDPFSLADSCPNVQEEEGDPVKSADKLVEQAASSVAAKENARKAREEAKARAKAEAKRKAEASARAKAEEARKALSAKLYADRCLGEATLALIAEVSRLNNGGAEQTASPAIAEHAEQLQPLAKSYGYKIAKPGVIAIVVKA